MLLITFNILGSLFSTKILSVAPENFSLPSTHRDSLRGCCTEHDFGPPLNTQRENSVTASKSFKASSLASSMCGASVKKH